MSALSRRVQLHLQEGLYEERHSKDAHLCLGAPAVKHHVPEKQIRGITSWPYTDDVLRADAIFLRTSQVSMDTIPFGTMRWYVLKQTARNVTTVANWTEQESTRNSTSNKPARVSKLSHPTPMPWHPWSKVFLTS